MSEPEPSFNKAFIEQSELEDIDRSTEIDINIPETHEGWVEKLKNIDYKDHAAAIVGVGAAAVALGVGVYELKKHGGKKVRIGFADRHFEKEGVISIVEKTERGGLAIGVATTKAALKALGRTKDVFAMEDGDVAYPLEREGDKDKSTRRVRTVAKWLMELHASRVNKSDQ